MKTSEKAAATIARHRDDDSLPSVPQYTPGQVVTEEQVHTAVDFLQRSVRLVGQVVTRGRRASHMLKHIESLEYKKSGASNESGRKADARTSEKYIEAIEEDAIAAGELAKIYAARETAGTIVEVWRTQEASGRKATKL
jgi:hypothetical protein